MGLKGCRRNPKSKEPVLGEASPDPLLPNMPKFIDNVRKCFVSPRVKLTDGRHKLSEERTCKPILKAKHIQLGFADAELSGEVSRITTVIRASWVSSGFQGFHFKS